MVGGNGTGVCNVAGTGTGVDRGDAKDMVDAARAGATTAGGVAVETGSRDRTTAGTTAKAESRAHTKERTTAETNVASCVAPSAPKVIPPLTPQLCARRGYISVGKRRALLQRSNGQCEWVSKQTGQRCEEKYHLEIEHSQPIAKGGSDSTANLQILCATHNRLRALQIFGPSNMSRYIPSIRSGPEKANTTGLF